MEALRIWVEHGPVPCPARRGGHAAVAAVALRGDYAVGYRALGRFLAAGEARGYEPGTSQARFLFAVQCCWFEPLENGVQQAQRAREGLLAGGDLATAGYTYHTTVSCLLDCAPSLDACVAEAEAGLAFARRTGNERVGQRLGCYRWLAGVLRGESSAAAEAVPADRDGNPLALFNAHLTRAVAAAIFGDLAGLARHTAAAMPLVAAAPGVYTVAVARLLRGLALAGQACTAGGDQRAGLLAELDEQVGWLAGRAADAPDNFLHLVRLVEAERAWAAGDFRAAALAFDAARREAAGRQRPWHRALIAERAAASTWPTAPNTPATPFLAKRARNTPPGARPPRPPSWTGPTRPRGPHRMPPPPAAVAGPGIFPRAAPRSPPAPSTCSASCPPRRR